MNETNFEGITHDDAVGFLKDAFGTLHFSLSREILPQKTEEEKDESSPEKRAGDSPSSMVVHEVSFVLPFSSEAYIQGAECGWRRVLLSQNTL